MAVPHLSPMSKFILLCEFFLVAYMLYVLTSSIYKSYQIDHLIQELESENDRIAQQNKQYSEDYQYYNSRAYKEKIAKENFGLVNPGEEVIILPADDKVYLSEEELLRTESEKQWKSTPNPTKWWMFFFDRTRGRFL